MNTKRIEELTDGVVNQFEQTCMGSFGEGRYADINYMRGVRVGSTRRLIDDAIKTAVQEHLNNEPKVAEMRRAGAKVINECFKMALELAKETESAICSGSYATALDHLKRMKENLELTIVKEWQ
jgi:dGTP triphosphohydrolase